MSTIIRPRTLQASPTSQRTSQCSEGSLLPPQPPLPPGPRNTTPRRPRKSKSTQYPTTNHPSLHLQRIPHEPRRTPPETAAPSVASSQDPYFSASANTTSPRSSSPVSITPLLPACTLTPKQKTPDPKICRGMIRECPALRRRWVFFFFAGGDWRRVESEKRRHRRSRVESGVCPLQGANVGDIPVGADGSWTVRNGEPLANNRHWSFRLVYLAILSLRSGSGPRHRRVGSQTPVPGRGRGDWR